MAVNISLLLLIRPHRRILREIAGWDGQTALRNNENTDAVYGVSMNRGRPGTMNLTMRTDARGQGPAKSRRLDSSAVPVGTTPLRCSAVRHSTGGHVLGMRRSLGRLTLRVTWMQEHASC